MDVLSNDSLRPCKLKIHLDTKKKSTMRIFQKLLNDFQARKIVFQVFNNKFSTASLPASYEISKIIAKAEKLHNIGETVILPAVSIIIPKIMKQNPSEIINSTPLSNSTVSRRIDEMADNVEKQLIANLRVKKFCPST